MKKLIAMLMLVALLASTVSALANVEFTGSAYLYKKAGSGKTKIIITKRSVVKDVKRGKYWTKIRLTTGKSYWVRTKYLRATKLPINEVYSAGGTNKSKKTSRVVTDNYSNTKYIYCWWKGKVRTSPSLSGRVIGTTKVGAKYLYLHKYAFDSRNQCWWKIKYKGKTAWVSCAARDIAGKPGWKNWMTGRMYYPYHVW